MIQVVETFARDRLALVAVYPIEALALIRNLAHRVKRQREVVEALQDGVDVLHGATLGDGCQKFTDI